MSIESIGSMNKILKSYDASQWVKSADLNVNKSINLVEGQGVSSPVENGTKRSFMDLLADSISNVNTIQKDANLAMERLATGKSKNIHETMLAIEKADIAFRSMNQVRQKVLDAYREVMKMQV